MGLDMYLEKAPRYKMATMRDVNVINSYLSWLENKKSDSEYKDCTLKEWCGVDEKHLPPKDYIDFYSQFRVIKYPEWDEEKECGHYSISEEVGYWRKANAIHKWFVDNVQNGIDDCRYHNEVTMGDLLKLKSLCKKIRNDKELASKLLPTHQGFFFGSYNYDEWYYRDIKDTIEIIEKILKTTDFDKEMIYYCSSW